MAKKLNATKTAVRPNRSLRLDSKIAPLAPSNPNISTRNTSENELTLLVSGRSILSTSRNANRVGSIGSDTTNGGANDIHTGGYIAVSGYTQPSTPTSGFSTGSTLHTDGTGNDVLDASMVSMATTLSTTSTGVLCGFNETTMIGNNVLTTGNAITSLSTTIVPVVGQFLFGTSGNDTLKGGIGADTINGGAGDDTLNGGYNVISGYTQSSIPTSGLSTGSTIYNSSGVDTYIFKKGDGKDVIQDFQSDTINHYGYQHEAIVFTDVTSNEVSFSTDGKYLTIHYGQGDQVKIFYPTDGSSGFISTALQSIQFSDGVKWSGSFLDVNIKNKLLTPVVGQFLFGTSGNDTLKGGVGADTFYGGAGDDVLSGGYSISAIDYSMGFGTGVTSQDTYVFRKGDGKDVITDRNSDMLSTLYWSEKEAIVFADAKSTEVTLASDGKGSLLMNYGNGDQVKIFVGTTGFGVNSLSNTALYSIQFSDGVLWSGEALRTRIQSALYNTVNSGSGNDSLVGLANKHNALYGNAGNDTLIGNNYTDHLTGGDGNDVLDGGTSVRGTGADQLFGGLGNDVYIVRAGSSPNITEYANEGTDTVQTSVSYTLGANIENLVLSEEGSKSYTQQGFGWNPSTNTSGWFDIKTVKWGDAINGIGNALNNRITGNTNDNIITGGKGSDTLTGGYGEDTFRFSRGDGQDVITDFETKGSLSTVDHLRWVDENGNVVIPPEGSTGPDSIIFTDVTSKEVTFSSDLNYLTIHYGLGDQVRLYAPMDKSNLISTGLMSIQFSDGVTWSGSVLAEKINNGLMTTIAGQSISGTSGNDSIRGSDGSDTINGGAGNDTLNGGYNVVAGNARPSTSPFSLMSTMFDSSGIDTYIFKKGDGKDIIKDYQSDMISQYGYQHEAIVFTDVTSKEVSFSSINGHHLIINYGQGDQIQIFYPVNGDAGVSTALQSIQFSDGVLWSGEVLKAMIMASAVNTVEGGNGNDSLVGLADKHNILYGNTGNDTLIGSNYADRLIGGAGDDILDGGVNVNGVVIDRLDGRLGNDIYIVRAGSTSRIEEYVNEGTDLIYSYGTYSLNDFNLVNVENLQLLGTSNFNATGNAGNNTLTGNKGNNVITAYEGNDHLNGLGGIDTLIGGTGNDTYYINAVDAATTIVENAGEGTDTVLTSVSYTLGANVENLTLANYNGHTYTAYNMLPSANGVPVVLQTGITWGDAINGTGNALNNRIVGNDKSNIINGGKGNDTLTGGLSGDVFLFKRGDGQDVITDFGNNLVTIDPCFTYWKDEAGATVYTQGHSFTSETVKFTSGVNYDQLWFTHQANDLVVSTIGTSDSVTFKNWYTGSRMMAITTSDGKTLGNVDNLVTAMAAFAPPAAGQTTLSGSYQSALAPVLAANWS